MKYKITTLNSIFFLKSIFALSLLLCVTKIGATERPNCDKLETVDPAPASSTSPLQEAFRRNQRPKAKPATSNNPISTLRHAANNGGSPTLDLHSVELPRFGPASVNPISTLRHAANNGGSPALGFHSGGLGLAAPASAPQEVTTVTISGQQYICPKLTCFISYAETDPQIKKIERFVALLKEASFLSVIFARSGDDNGLRYGEEMPKFMQKVRDSDFVIVMFSPTYKEASERLFSGVSYELTILRDRLVENHKASRGNDFFCPCLLPGHTPEESIPVPYRHHMCLELYESGTSFSHKDLVQLIALRGLEMRGNTLPEGVTTSTQKLFPKPASVPLESVKKLSSKSDETSVSNLSPVGDDTGRTSSFVLVLEEQPDGGEEIKESKSSYEGSFVRVTPPLQNVLISTFSSRPLSEQESGPPSHDKRSPRVVG